MRARSPSTPLAACRDRRSVLARGALLGWLCAALAVPVAAQRTTPPAADAARPAEPAQPSAAPGRPSATDASSRAASAADAARAPAQPTPRPPVTPLPPIDPLEHLRQRLAERLSVRPLNPATGAQELQLIGRQPAGAATAGARAATATGAGAARGSSAGAGPRRAASPRAPEGPAWSYGGTTGPDAWGRLKPEYALCASGERQSPVDIRGGLAVDLEALAFEYLAAPFSVLDNGHTIQAQPEAGSVLVLGGRRYALQHLHFHRPSEERIDGRQFEMSIHLVHRDDQGRVAVVALVLDPGPAHPVVQQVWNHLPLEKHQTVQARQALDLGDLLPQDRRYYTYMGSLTTPPCTEGVQWVVMREPVSVSPEQIALFERLYPMNARPVQPLSGRRILQSD